MKKIFILGLIVVVVTLIALTNEEETIVVNSELEDNEMLTVLLTVPGLNSNNFTNYFDDSIEIIGIYPEVNMLYKKKIGNMFYIFNKNSIKQDINSFIKYYKGVLKKHNFNNDLVLIDYNGINIEKVKVYVSGEKLEDFIRGCSSCKYEKTSQK